MRKFVVLIKFQVLAATGCLALFAIATPPDLSQASSPETEAVVETTLEADTAGEESAEPAYTAISAENPEISTLQLQLLLNPLTADKLTAEADAANPARAHTIHQRTGTGHRTGKRYP